MNSYEIGSGNFDGFIGPEKATELEYLRWFYSRADFGPADSDVRHWMNENFKRFTGKDLPEGYEEGE